MRERRGPIDGRAEPNQEHVHRTGCVQRAQRGVPATRLRLTPNVSAPVTTASANVALAIAVRSGMEPALSPRSKAIVVPTVTLAGAPAPVNTVAIFDAGCLRR